VKTNVGKKFLQLMDKHFPVGNPLHKIFNRNSVKMSYRCTANLGMKIKAHNSKILKIDANEETRSCNCRKKDQCPVENKCLTNSAVYPAIVKRTDGVTDSYVGLTENTFKDRWTKHKSSFKIRNPKNASGLSKYIWKLDDEHVDCSIEWKIISRAQPFDPGTGVCRLWKNTDSVIKWFVFKSEWKIISRAKPFDPGTGVCRLCIREKYFIIFKPNMATINSRSEIGGPCLHEASKLLSKC
jgi:hypothetical protein